MIRYEKSVELSGDLDAAMAMAKTIFATNGFKVTQGSDNTLSVTGPGMRSTKENPIRGLSRGELTFTNSTVELSGELGGVEFMKKFLFFFPPALGLGLAAFFTFIIKNSDAGFTPLLCIAPWLFISPLMAKWIQKRTEQAISTALANISNA